MGHNNVKLTSYGVFYIRAFILVKSRLAIASMGADADGAFEINHTKQ